MEMELDEITKEKSDLVQQLEVLAISKAKILEEQSQVVAGPSSTEMIQSTSSITLNNSMTQEYDDLQEKADALEAEKVTWLPYFLYLFYFYSHDYKIS